MEAAAAKAPSNVEAADSAKAAPAAADAAAKAAEEAGEKVEAAGADVKTEAKKELPKVAAPQNVVDTSTETPTRQTPKRKCECRERVAVKRGRT